MQEWYELPPDQPGYYWFHKNDNSMADMVVHIVREIDALTMQYTWFVFMPGRSGRIKLPPVGFRISGPLDNPYEGR